jgi:hypothetical protein
MEVWMYIKLKIAGYYDRGKFRPNNPPVVRYALISENEFYVGREDGKVCVRSVHDGEEAHHVAIVDTPAEFEERLRKAGLLVE